MDLRWTSFMLLLTALGGRSQTNVGLDQPDLEQFLQPDTVGDDPAASLSGSRRRCDRACVRGAKPRLCYYKLNFEDYHVLGAACRNCPTVQSDCARPQCITADGIERGILTANRRLPGPSIQVCEGDRVVVDVHNLMPGRTTTIHFHGIFQDESNAMDGVPMVTQCPINEGSTFRYDFLANNAGTHFWHSHDGFQKMDGLLGSLIVRKPSRDDPSSKLYHDDLPAHVMLLSDWFETGSDQKFPGLRNRMPGQEPVSYLINGKGRVSPVEKSNDAKATARFAYGVQMQSRSVLDDVFSRIHWKASRSSGPNATTVPLTTFEVTRGRRYRFRLISGTCAHCPAEVSIAQHRLRVIGTDGNAVKGVLVDRIVVLPGERYDFVLDASQTRSAYWIQVRGMGPCADRSTSGVAVLRYRGSRVQTPATADPHYTPVNTNRPVTMNPFNGKCGPRDNAVCVNQLETVDGYNSRLKMQHPDITLDFNFDFKLLTAQETFRPGEYQRFLQPVVADALVTAHMNNISNVLGASPLYQQFHDIPPGLFCPKSGCSSPTCECLHLVKVPLNALVEMVIKDEANASGELSHPFHLHGHKFHVLALGTFEAAHHNQPAQRRMAMKTTTDAALESLRSGSAFFAGKDTVAVPAYGFAVVRFIADNPGFWMVHCHYIYHQVVGMNLVLQVGELPQIPRPPRGFPTCGNFLGHINTASYV